MVDYVLFVKNVQTALNIPLFCVLLRLFAALKTKDEYYRILFIVLKTRLADIGRRIQYSL